ncbi:HD domain-containing protein [Paenibacillus sp. Marseille-P2973]|uniref:HD domain-containing protein n=1 Tax=Paenibacillus sp. Marseille-P2973 TaxID=1871032 RepID=UPI001B36659F|nr:HD domain-containing protein [Paenibacillus sp. Marseille-P2973]MBQ4898810.1 HD domain-containing protein [Paenibacillus sp. Marseille-P2973]
MEKMLKQFNFIVEIDKLKTIERRTKIIHGSRLENDAEHSWHLAMMAMILQHHANKTNDLLKVIKMLLIHDLVEIDAGDTFAYDTDGQVDKFDRETEAAKRLFGMLPAEQEEEFTQLWLEFENKETEEAKFASSLDRLQPLIHNSLNEGDTWQKYGITSEQVINRNKEINYGSEKLWEYAQTIIKSSVEQGILTK